MIYYSEDLECSWIFRDGRIKKYMLLCLLLLTLRGNTDNFRTICLIKK